MSKKFNILLSSVVNTAMCKRLVTISHWHVVQTLRLSIEQVGDFKE